MKIKLPDALTHARTSEDEGPPVPSQLDTLSIQLGLQTEQGRIALEYFLCQAILFDKKQQDYGSKNISRFGLPGVVMKISDKTERLITLSGNKRRKPQNESVRDTLQDLSNYGVIGQIVEDSRWLP